MKKKVILILLATLIISVSATAGTVSVSSTAPVVDGSDIAQFSGPYGNDSAVDYNKVGKWWTGTDDPGQTFTSSNDVILNAFTLQSGHAGNEADFDFTLRVSTISGNNLTPIYTESMTWVSGAYPTNSYITFTLGTPIILSGGTLYAIDVSIDAVNISFEGNIPYLMYEKDSDTYVDGERYFITSAADTTAALQAGQDYAFHLDMDIAPADLPDVDAGSNWISWSGEPVVLDDVVVVNNSNPVAALTYSWTADPADGVVFTPSAAVESPTVTITKTTDNPSVVTLTLAVNNVGSANLDVTDSMTIDLYDNSCEAGLVVNSVALDDSDFDTDCATNLGDFAEIAAAWLLDYTASDPIDK